MEARKPKKAKKLGEGPFERAVPHKTEAKVAKEKLLQDATGHINEATHALSLMDVEIAELQKKADKLKPLAAEYDAQAAKLAKINAEIEAAPAKLAQVQAELNAEIGRSQARLAEIKKAHAEFAKLATV